MKLDSLMRLSHTHRRLSSKNSISYTVRVGDAVPVACIIQLRPILPSAECSDMPTPIAKCSVTTPYGWCHLAFDWYGVPQNASPRSSALYCFRKNNNLQSTDSMEAKKKLTPTKRLNEVPHLDYDWAYKQEHKY